MNATINRFTLPNGLRVANRYDPLSPMVAMTVIYDVGARDEDPDMTGIAHLFEHLMFGGSTNIPAFDEAIERAGGINNAWTSNDFTCFYSMCPKENIETLMWLESDRMLSLAFNEKSLETQRQVVIEEFKQTTLNQPYGDVFHILRSLLYNVHPYRFPVIGKEIGHIEKVTLDDIKRFFYSHYAPNNAVLTLCGNITDSEARALVQKWFGPIEPRNIAPRNLPQEPPIDKPRRLVVEKDVPQTTIYIAWPMGGYKSPDYIPLDLMTDVLSSGKASRLEANVVSKGDLFSAASASIAGSEEPGFLLMMGRLLHDSPDDIAKAEKVLVEQAAEIARNGVTEHELRRSMNRNETSILLENMKVAAQSIRLALNEIHGQTMDQIIDAYRKVTPEDILNVAKATIRPERQVTLVYKAR